jgi:C_GCAxxG_C_C family probable redox protein
MTTKGDTIMERAEMAAEFMSGGLNCSQSIVKAFASELEVDEDAAVRMATSFGGGFGRCGYVCGALSGAAFVLGARFGNIVPDDTVARDRAYAAERQLLERFLLEHGAVMCRELIGVDLRNPEAMKRAREEGVFAKRCSLFVKSSGRILEEILAGK